MTFSMRTTSSRRPTAPGRRSRISRRCLRGYFRVSGAPLIALQPDQRGSCYVAVQVQFDPVRLMPPLTIVSLAGAGGRFTTPWTRAEIPR